MLFVREQLNYRRFSVLSALKTYTLYYTQLIIKCNYDTALSIKYKLAVVPSSSGVRIEHNTLLQ